MSYFHPLCFCESQFNQRSRPDQRPQSRGKKGVKLHKAVFPVLVSIRTSYKYNNPHNYKEIEKGHLEPAHQQIFGDPFLEIISIVLVTDALFWRGQQHSSEEFQNCTNRFDYVNILLHFFRYATTPVG